MGLLVQIKWYVRILDVSLGRSKKSGTLLTSYWFSIFVIHHRSFSDKHLFVLINFVYSWRLRSWRQKMTDWSWRIRAAELAPRSPSHLLLPLTLTARAREQGQASPSTASTSPPANPPAWVRQHRRDRRNCRDIVYERKKTTWCLLFSWVRHAAWWHWWRRRDEEGRATCEDSCQPGRRQQMDRGEPSPLKIYSLSLQLEYFEPCFHL